MRFAPALWLAVMLGVLGVAGPAVAHQSLVSRAIKIEPAADRVYVWISLKVPAGRHKDVLLATTPRRRDGTFEPAAQKGLEKALAVRALDGVALTVEGATVSLDRAELKLSAPAEPDAPLELAVLGSAPLSARASRLALAIIRVSDPTELTLLAGARPVTDTSRGTIVRGGVETVMGSPDRVQWRLAAPVPPK